MHQRLMPSLARRLAEAVDAVPLVVTRVGEPHRCARGTHTRVGDGRQLCWAPGSLLMPMPYAVDAEVAGRAVPATLGRRSGVIAPDEFWPLWTRAEVRAKVRDVPILLWIDEIDWTHDADVPGADEVALVVTRRVDDLVVSQGLLPEPAR